ncbi:MAG: BrnT family toxin [Geminicoccaceae bacterium]
MDFEWDERKRRANLAKHGIDFAALDQMFRANLLEEDDTRRHYGERRIKAIGEANGVIVSVVYTWRGDRRRLISARRARADERKEYQAKLAAG